MQWFLDGLSAELAADVHALQVLDQAGWHVTDQLQVPANLTRLALPPSG